MSRTFSKADWDAAQALWSEGNFSREWREVRHQAAMHGIIYPPEGTRWDSWEDDAPSQRAILIRAIRETPKLLTEAVGRARSWGEVIAYVLQRRDEWRADLNDRERLLDFEKPTNRQALTSLADIIQRIGDSR